MPELNYGRITTRALRTSNYFKWSPITGNLNSAIIYFPAGCNGNVEVIVNHKRNMVLPWPSRSSQPTTGIALNETTQSFDIDIPVEKDDPLEVVVTNHDDTKTHRPSVILLIKRTKSYTGP